MEPRPTETSHRYGRRRWLNFKSSGIFQRSQCMHPSRCKIFLKSTTLMAQSFWAGLSNANPVFVQQSLDVAPGSHAGISPKRLVKLFLELATTQSKRQVQVFNQNPSNGHGAPTPLLPFLQALRLNNVVIEIDMSDGQKKCFRNATAGIRPRFQ